MLKSVVLPAPFGPMIEEMPRSTAKSTAWSAVRPPNRLVTPRASKRCTALLRHLALAAAGREDSLRAVDHHQHEDDAEDHPLVLRRLELGGQVGEAVAQHGHAGVLQLVEPEREALQHLKIEHRHHGRA